MAQAIIRVGYNPSVIVHGPFALASSIWVSIEPSLLSNICLDLSLHVEAQAKHEVHSYLPVACKRSSGGAVASKAMGLDPLFVRLSRQQERNRKSIQQSGTRPKAGHEFSLCLLP